MSVCVQLQQTRHYGGLMHIQATTAGILHLHLGAPPQTIYLLRRGGRRIITRVGYVVIAKMAPQAMVPHNAPVRLLFGLSAPTKNPTV